MKKIHIIFMLFLFTVAAHAVGPLDHTSMMQKHDQQNRDRQVPEDEEDVYFLLTGEADKAIAECDYPTAILRLKEAMNCDPSNPSNVMLLSNLGMVYSYMGQDSLALQAYDNALSIAPSMVTVLANRALQKLKMGRDKEAFADFEQVISKDSLNVTARYYHGIMSLYKGKLEVAKTDFEVLESKDPDGYDTSVALATLNSFEGKPTQAARYYKKLVEKDPSPEFYSALAMCYIDANMLSEAGTTIAEGLEKCGDDAELYYCRARLNKESYRNEEAKKDARRAVSLGADPSVVKELFK